MYSRGLSPWYVLHLRYRYTYNTTALPCYVLQQHSAFLIENVQLSLVKCTLALLLDTITSSFSDVQLSV